MKLWEAMRLLEEDPSRKFEYQDDQKKWLLYADAGCCDDRVFYMLDCWHDKGELITEYRGGSLHGNLSTLDNWQPARQSVWKPVTWQEAIQAWADGKRVTLKLDRCEYAFCGFSDQANTRRAINSGTWYVED